MKIKERLYNQALAVITPDIEKRILKDDTLGVYFSFDKTEPFVPIPELDNIANIAAHRVLAKTYHTLDKSHSRTNGSSSGGNFNMIFLHPVNQYHTALHYYDTLFHELGHLAGKDLKCPLYSLSGYYGGTYNQEEIVAELVSIILLTRSGYKNNSAIFYLAIWFSRIAKYIQNLEYFTILYTYAEQRIDYLLHGKIVKLT